LGNLTGFAPSRTDSRMPRNVMDAAETAVAIVTERNAPITR
jgi:hypothetical protein